MDDLSEDEKSSSMKKIKEINQLIIKRAGIDNNNKSKNVSN